MTCPDPLEDFPACFCRGHVGEREWCPVFEWVARHPHCPPHHLYLEHAKDVILAGAA